MSTYFTFDWGGTDILTVEQVWPDGDAPENPTTDDVIKALRSRGDFMDMIARDWNLELQDIEVSGPGGRRSLARVLHDERKAVASEGTEKP